VPDSIIDTSRARFLTWIKHAFRIDAAAQENGGRRIRELPQFQPATGCRGAVQAIEVI
jgi:hypothetical protein